MSILFGKMEAAFELSGASKEAHAQYQVLLNMHNEVFQKVNHLRRMTDESLTGKTEIEVKNNITMFEKKLYIIEMQLEELKKSIGGGY